MPGDRDCQNVCCQAAESCLASVGILVRTDIHKITYVAALLFIRLHILWHIRWIFSFVDLTPNCVV